MSKVRYALLSHDFFPIQGGLGRHATGLLQAINEYSAKMMLLGISPNKNNLYNHHNELAWTKKLPLDQLQFSIGLHFSLTAIVEKYSLEGLLLNAGPGGVFCLKKPAKKLLVIANHTYEQQKLLKGQNWKKVFIPFEHRTYQNADHIVAISSTTKEVLLTQYGIQENKITVIPPGHFFQERHNTPDSTANGILFIGRLDSRKGVAFLIDSFAKAASSIPSSHLHIVGAGRDQQKLQRKVEQFGLEQRVTFHGYASEEHISKLREKCLVQVIPSQFEGFGIAAVEAHAAGTPLIGTSTAGLTDSIEHEHTGLLVPYGDVADLAEKIQFAFDNRERMLQFAAAGLQMAKSKFAWEHVVKQYDALM